MPAGWDIEIAVFGSYPRSGSRAASLDEASRQWCNDEIAKLRSERVFTPPSVRGSYLIPRNVAAWRGGAAYERKHHLLVIPVNNLARGDAADPTRRLRFRARCWPKLNAIGNSPSNA